MCSQACLNPVLPQVHKLSSLAPQSFTHHLACQQQPSEEPKAACCGCSVTPGHRICGTAAAGVYSGLHKGG